MEHKAFLWRKQAIKQTKNKSQSSGFLLWKSSEPDSGMTARASDALVILEPVCQDHHFGIGDVIGSGQRDGRSCAALRG